jgi:hypothetical protein
LAHAARAFKCGPEHSALLGAHAYVPIHLNQCAQHVAGHANIGEVAHERVARDATIGIFKFNKATV